MRTKPLLVLSAKSFIIPGQLVSRELGKECGSCKAKPYVLNAYKRTNACLGEQEFSLSIECPSLELTE